MNKRVVDFHCDALSKLLLNGDLSFQGASNGELDVTYERLKAAGTALQVFAIYVPESMNGPIEPILESISRFHSHVLACPDMLFVRSKSDLRQCLSEGKIGAMLSLEGVDGLKGNLSLVQIMYELGVRAAGLTWNYTNWAADGVMEPRGGGLTGKGKRMVAECDRLGILVDVSHLSERAFWDVADAAERTIIASHSNAKAVLDHPRNLTDDQVKAIIALQGLLGVTFVPWFVADKASVGIDDVLRHVEHLCELGGENHIMLGSDFDGIDRYVQQLTHPGQTPLLRDALLKRYTEGQTDAFMAGNALRFLERHLPE
ncbi:dipeptidase [Paenibacillus sp. NPDC058071]|uniref:dipeptidase n=1 Tax=Paenibacillus sp. NPDC058071 TaxID=3346326 RepID=UPI0036DACAC6